ncbi:hypothetical protein [Paenibacillus piri]|nr:hypothetical protein [Paenibacillus piri]
MKEQAGGMRTGGSSEHELRKEYVAVGLARLHPTLSAIHNT